jgi:hypothetical protein
MITIFLAGLAAWIATSTIVEAEVFRDVREACDRVHNKHNNWWTYKLRYLIHCHMCTGIWVSALIALMVNPFVSGGVLGWGITALAIKGIGHSFLVLQKLFEAKTEEHTQHAALQKHDLERELAWEKEHAESVD